MTPFFQDNLHFIHFTSALALFILALFFLKARRVQWMTERLPSAWCLAAFTLLHSIAHGMEGFSVYRSMVSGARESLFLRGAATVADVLSFGLLLCFGLRGIFPASRLLGRTLAPVLMALWVAALAAGLILDPAQAGEWTERAKGLGEVAFALSGGILAALVFWKVPPGRFRAPARATAALIFTFGMLEAVEPFFHKAEIPHLLSMAAVAIALGVPVSRFLSLGIGTKLTAGLAAGYALTLIVGSAGYLGFGVVEREVARAEALEEETRALLNLQRSLERALSFRSVAFPAEEVERRLEESFWAHRQAHRSSEHQEVGALLEAARQEYQKLKAGAAGTGALEEILARLESHQTQHRAEVFRARARAKEARNNIRLAILLGLGVAGLGALTFGLLFSRAITGPLRFLREGARGIGRGESRRIEVSTGDEMEELAGEFNAMAERLRARRNELLALNSIAQAVSASLDLDRVLSAALERVIDVTGADAGIVYLWDSEVQLLRVRAHRGLSPAYVGGVDRIRMGEGLVGKVVGSGEPAVVEDVLSDPRIIRPQYVRGEGIRSVLMVPLKSKAATVGMYYVATRQLRRFTPPDVELMVSVGHQIATAIDNATLFQEAVEQTGRLEGLIRSAGRLTGLLQIGDLLSGIAEEAARLLGVGGSGFRLLEGDRLVVAGRYGLANEVMLTPSIRSGESLSGLILKEDRPIAVPDLREDQTYLPAHKRAAIERGVAGFLGVPLRHAGKVIGALHVYSKERGVFSSRDIALLAAFADLAAVAIANARLVESLKATLEDLKVAQEQIVKGQTLRAVGELAAGAAHHLNNLLAVVVGRAQLLRQTAQEPALQRALKIVERAALDGAEVVRRMLQFSRARSGGKAVPVDLNRVAGEAVEFTRPRWQDEAQSQGRLIETTLEAGPIPPVAGQPSELREVVTNLILNAVDALPEGGRIALATWKEGSWVFLSVADTGIGMAPEVKARAFEPFFSTKGVRSTGLGLSVAHGIIQRHGGEIAIESKEGKGTTVTLRLPALEREEPVAEAPPKESGRSARILVIDDEPEVRETLVDYLMAEGHSVTSAADGWQGIAKIEGETFDLVITDLGMPGMTGWQVAEAVKSRFPGMPVVLITGWADTLEPGEESRVDGVLAKPFQIDGLRDLLSRLLSSTRLGGGVPSGNGSRGR